MFGFTFNDIITMDDSFEDYLKKILVGGWWLFFLLMDG